MPPQPVAGGADAVDGFAAPADGGTSAIADGGGDGGTPKLPTWSVTRVPTQASIMGFWGPDSHNIVAVDERGVIWRSSGDDNWSMAQDTGFIHAGLEAVTGDSAHNLFAGGWSQQLWHSTDAGRTWLLVGPTAFRVNALALANGVLIAGAEEGLFRSADGGQTFARAGGITDFCNVVYGRATDVVTVGIGPNSVVTAYVSHDEGLSFDAVVLDEIHRWTVGGVWSDGDGTIVISGNALEPPGVPYDQTTTVGYVATSHDGGATFEVQELSAPIIIGRDWGASAGDIWVTSEHAQLVHFDGTTWNRTLLPGTYSTTDSSADLSAVWGLSAADIYVGGHSGIIAHLRQP